MAEEQVAKVTDQKRLDFGREGLVLEENIAYAHESGRQIMDLIYPKERRGPLPVVVWIHGGGWSDEKLDKRYRPEPELGELAKEGFLIASIEYRLCQHAPFPAQIADCKRAVRFLRANAEQYRINPGRIGVWGESAGGHLAGLLGVTEGVRELAGGCPEECSSGVQAVCAWYTPYDMLKIAQDKPEAHDPVFERLFGGSTAEKRELIWSASPMKYVKGGLPPFLIMHGTVDKLVPYAQSVNFYNAMRAAGNDAEMISVPGQGHGFFSGREYYEAIFAFFKKHLQ